MENIDIVAILKALLDDIIAFVKSILTKEVPEIEEIF